MIAFQEGDFCVGPNGPGLIGETLNNVLVESASRP